MWTYYVVNNSSFLLSLRNSSVSQGQGPKLSHYSKFLHISTSLSNCVECKVSLYRIFLGATKSLYKRVCPSVDRRSVRRSVTPSLIEVFRSTYCRVSGLFSFFADKAFFQMDSRSLLITGIAIDWFELFIG